jgi:IS605 OrfB family transposase
MSGLVTTYQMRLPRGSHEDVLGVVAAHLCATERHLHSALKRLHRAAGGDAEVLRVGKNDLKRRFLTGHGITGRQYNSLLRGLEGRYASLQELAKARVETTERRLRALAKKITARGRKLDSFAKISAAVEARARLGKGPTKAQAKRLLSRDEYDKARFIQHQQKRRAEILRTRIERDRGIAAAAVPPMVFGSKALLQQRAAVHANDLDGLAAWRRKWERARSAQFLVIGSSDETAGCQSCVATALDLPIVIESLDFAAKKRDLEGSGAGYARMLSSLAYAAIQTTLRRRAARAGVELVAVNPAYTSVIGRVNYARRYGLSAHCAAAVAIARRAAGLSERVNYVHGSRGRRNTLLTQSECRRHVWRQWARVRKDLVARDSQNGKRHTAGAVSSASSYCPQGHEGGDVRLRKQHAACPVRSRPDQGIQGALLTPGSDHIPHL